MFSLQINFYTLNMLEKGQSNGSHKTQSSVGKCDPSSETCEFIWQSECPILVLKKSLRMKTWVVCLQVLSYEELSFMNNVKVRRATGKSIWNF